PGDIQSLNAGRMRYTVFLNANGGIIDDLIVTDAGDHILIVVNAACRQKDLQFMKDNLQCDVEELENKALLALQGPMSEMILETIAPGVADLKFMSSGEFSVCGEYCFITRSGYTGEDGFEISMPANMAMEIAETILSHESAELIGLGARDSLRLEAGLCLYGQDLNETITPIEADLGWVIGKRRRQDGGFPGLENITRQLRDGAPTRRVGIRPNGRAPAREGTEIFDLEEKK
ncbi:MAG: glycine cleavage system aminomethyltransferase GcvT, partial [Alphaproteobacteria bacterium]|nr:glycine cleavage system aminomethyltransferase GcvT [Alphaproteobacteria bacterium]